MKLTASCTPFEALPPKLWECLKREITSAFHGWGVALDIEDAPSVVEAEVRFQEWQNRPGAP